jgi:hypothetical protein
MGLFDKLFGRKTEPVVEVKEPPKPKKPRKPREPKQLKVELSAKDIATQKGEPYIHIVSMEVDPENINSGAFELDWNDKFVLNLVRAGYKKREDDTDQIIVDRWFQTVCRNIALEVYEQEMADPDNRYRADVRVVRSRDLGDGRSEVS